MKVAVAVIFDDQQRVLITRRSVDTSHGGLWEFPGGKLEEGELPTTALLREIKEEVGIDILNYQFLGNVLHDYGNKTVDLLIFSVDKFQGEAYCRESQSDLRWTSVDKLANYEFPEANKQVIALVKKHRLGFHAHSCQARENYFN